MRKKLFGRWQLILWAIGFFALLGALISQFYPKYVGMVILFFYMVPSNTFIGIPHEPMIIFYGKQFGPLSTTLLAVIPTVLGCLVDYVVLTPAFRKTRLKKIKTTRIYCRTIKYFEKAPFLTILTFAITPVPFYPVRILSIASEYPNWRYVLAVLSGRLPRYYTLAFFGAVINIPDWLIVTIFALIIGIALARKLYNRRVTDELTEEYDRSIEEELPSDEPIAPEIIRE